MEPSVLLLEVEANVHTVDSREQEGVNLSAPGTPCTLSLLCPLELTVVVLGSMCGKQKGDCTEGQVQAVTSLPLVGPGKGSQAQGLLTGVQKNTPEYASGNLVSLLWEDRGGRQTQLSWKLALAPKNRAQAYTGPSSTGLGIKTKIPGLIGSLGDCEQGPSPPQCPQQMKLRLSFMTILGCHFSSRASGI